MFLCSRESSRVAPLFPHLPRHCHDRSQERYFTISAENECSRSGKLSILDTSSKSDPLGVPVVSGTRVLRGVSGFRFLALTLVLGKACLADNRDNAVETNTQTHTPAHTAERLRERATGGTLSCALSMKSQLVRMSHIPG